MTCEGCDLIANTLDQLLNEVKVWMNTDRGVQPLNNGKNGSEPQYYNNTC